MRSPQFKVRQGILPLLVSMCVALGQTALGQAALGQAGRPEDRSDAQAANQEETQREEPDGGTPELGVIVAGSPGRGILVTEVVSGSPASQASIRPGDFILSVDGQEVSTPAELRASIRAREAGGEVQVVVWRAGEESAKGIVLAKRAPEHSRQGAWLGVILSPTEEDGAKIDRVYPGSPAARAGLRPGDVVTGINDKPIASAGQMTDLIQELEPHSKIHLQVLRELPEERELEITATLGTTRRSWPLQRLRPFAGPNVRGWLADPRGDRQMQLEETLEELRQQVEELREQVRQLSGQPSEPQEKAPNPGDQSNNPGLPQNNPLPHQNNPALRENNPGEERRGVQSNAARGRNYYQDYGHYYRFQRPPSRSFQYRDYLWRQPPTPYSYYPHPYYPYAPPYTYYRQDGQTYYYLAPEGPRFGTRIGPYWFEYSF